jgi:O-antigen biosynthesis protein WbqP
LLCLYLRPENGGVCLRNCRSVFAYTFNIASHGWCFFDSGLPTIFAQSRVGKFRRIFVCLKLRAMPKNTRSLVSHKLPPVDLAGYSKFMRRYKSSELPQLINVLLGQISLVGPRPCLPQQREFIAPRNNNDIFKLKPGITGLTQIIDIDMSDPEKHVAFETEYLNEAGFLMDLKILLATLTGKGLQTHAARKNK